MSNNKRIEKMYSMSQRLSGIIAEMQARKNVMLGLEYKKAA